MFLKNKSQIRHINWGSSHRWDIRFPDAPEPFSTWFPATDVEENIYTLNTKTFEFYLSTYEVPLSTTLFDLKITFIDDELDTVHNWIADWVNSTMLVAGAEGSALHVATVKDASRIVQLVKLNPQGEPVSDVSYWVMPKGGGYYTGTSTASVKSNMVEFVITGTVDPVITVSQADAPPDTSTVA